MKIYKSAYFDLENCLKELSSIELQKKLWLNINNDTNMISSYDELFNTIYSQSTFYMINYEFDYLGANPLLKENFRNLLKLLKNYKEPAKYYIYKDDNLIIDDSNWEEIVQYAKIVLNLWLYDVNIQTIISSPDNYGLSK